MNQKVSFWFSVQKKNFFSVEWERKRDWFIARAITNEQFVIGETNPSDQFDLEPV